MTFANPGNLRNSIIQLLLKHPPGKKPPGRDSLELGRCSRAQRAGELASTNKTSPFGAGLFKVKIGRWRVVLGGLSGWLVNEIDLVALGWFRLVSG